MRMFQGQSDHKPSHKDEKGPFHLLWLLGRDLPVNSLCKLRAHAQRRAAGALAPLRTGQVLLGVWDAVVLASILDDWSLYKGHMLECRL